MTIYNVVVTREGNLWVADVVDLRPGVTDVEHFGDLNVEVRDLIAGLTDSDPHDCTIRWRYEINGIDVTEKLNKLLAVESELRAVTTTREAVRNEAVATLAQAGVSQRAIGDVVGVSHQRINQLIHS